MCRKVLYLVCAWIMLIMSPCAISIACARTKTREVEALRAPLNIAILIQDDLTSQVGNELGVTRDFIRSLPAGSSVMVGYITAGSLQVRQPFTTRSEEASCRERRRVQSEDGVVESKSR